MSSNTKLEDYNAGSSLKDIVDKNLEAKQERWVDQDLSSLDESEVFMINNHRDNFRKYNRVGYSKSDREDILEQIDDLIDAKSKDKLKEN